MSPLADCATWKGKHIADLDREELLEALGDKVTELRWCYAEMTLSQMKKVAERLKNAGLA